MLLSCQPSGMSTSGAPAFIEQWEERGVWKCTVIGGLASEYSACNSPEGTIDNPPACVRACISKPLIGAAGAIKQLVYGSVVKVREVVKSILFK